MRTVNPQRFIVPGERSAALDLSSEPVTRFVQFLKDHHTVVDPTMATFEDTFLGRPGKIGPAQASASCSKLSNPAPPTARACF